MLPSVLWFLLEAGLFLVGAILYWNRPHDPAARLFFIQLVVVIGAYIGGYHWWRIATQPALILPYIVCATLLPAVSLHFYLLFPRPKRFWSRHRILVLAAVYGPPGAFLALIAAGYGGVRWLVRGDAPPEQVNRAMAGLRELIHNYFAVAVVWYALSLTALVHSFRTARDTTERHQAGWILLGAAVAALPIGFSWYLAIWHPTDFSGGAAIWPMFAASVCFTIAFTVGITRHRLLHFDQLLNQGMAYFLVSALAALVYCGLVWIGMLLLGRLGPRGPSLEQAAWVGGSALVLALGMDLARARLRSLLDRRFRRDKHQLDHTIEELGRAVGRLVDPPALAAKLLHVTADLYGTDRGAIYLGRNGPPFLPAARLGESADPCAIEAGDPLTDVLTSRELLTLLDPDAHSARRRLRGLGGAVALGLSHEGRLLGILILGPRPTGPFRSEDLARLSAFAPLAAVALANADGHRTIEALNRELRDKVEKISEQQRRILALQRELFNRNRRDEAPAESDDKAPPDVGGMIGSSAALTKVLEMASKVAASPSAVLIRGESGTGKELLARAIHEHGTRSGKPFVKVHCAALAPGVLESELFGHVRGAFTGAVRDKPGRFEMADGGTIFLDEIGDIGPEVQTKLLRVIQEQTFERVGSNQSVNVDVRLVTATHQDLEELIRRGCFREDLYYRLNVISLTMPPLRDRGDDVLELAQHFLTKYSSRIGKRIDQFDDDAVALLRHYDWPGNVRELENAIERGVVVADGPLLTADDLPPELRRKKDTRPRSQQAGDRRSRQERERLELAEALRAAGGNRSRAARALGVARTTLISRMRRHGIET